MNEFHTSNNDKWVDILNCQNCNWCTFDRTRGGTIYYCVKKESNKLCFHYLYNIHNLDISCKNREKKAKRFSIAFEQYSRLDYFWNNDCTFSNIRTRSNNAREEARQKGCSGKGLRFFLLWFGNEVKILKVVEVFSLRTLPHQRGRRKQDTEIEAEASQRGEQDRHRTETYSAIRFS